MNTKYESTNIPFPFVVGCVGFVIGLLEPGGIDAGEGFLIGFGIGVVFLILSTVLSNRIQ